MPTIAESVLLRPNSWQEFEHMCRDIYARKWQDPDAHLNGRQGQAQHGVDVYGRPPHLNGRYSGLQAKNYDDGNLNETIIRAEIAKAEGFDTGVAGQQIAEYIIATTERQDATLQQIVRRISAEREVANKFPVEIVFWGDICDELTSPQNHDLLIKYYPDLYQTIVAAYQESPEYQAIVEAQDNLKMRLQTVQERRLNEQWQLLKNDLEAGYVEARRSDIVNLVAEMERQAVDTGLNIELRGRIYLLAASAFFPSRIDGDAARSRFYLDKAAALPLETEQLHYRLHEAVLLLQTDGPEAALDSIANLSGPQVDRVRLAIYLGSGNEEGARQLVSSIDPQMIRSEQWRQIMVLYWGTVGDKDRLTQELSRLLEGDPTAANYSDAALACSRLAYRRHAAFYEEHGLYPIPISALGLQERIDGDMRLRAAELYAQAAPLYRAHGCRREAIGALLPAINLLAGEPQNTHVNEWLSRLAELDPEHAQVLFPPNAASTGVEEAARMMAKAQSLLQGGNASDVPYAIDLALRSAQAGQPVRDLLDLLEQHATLFNDGDSSSPEYLTAIYVLRESLGSSEETDTWFEGLRLPSEYAYVAVLLSLLHYTRHDPQKAAQWVQKAETEYGNNPEILAALAAYYRAVGDHRQEAAYARRLHNMVGTSATAAMLLDALSSVREYREYLQLAAQMNYLPPNEQWVRRGCAHACLELGRFPQAREHLEWLRANGLASAADTNNLLFTYDRLGQFDEMIAVLTEQVEQNPDDVRSYLGLSHAFVQKGDLPAAHEWGRKALTRFSDNPDAASHYMFLAHRTGFDDDPNVPEVMRAFHPGGAHEAVGNIRMATLDDLIELMRENARHAEYLWKTYRAGSISSLMYLHARRTTLFAFHYLGVHFPGWRRYTAVGDQPYNAPWLKEHNPGTVVLEYTALLTLWSLYREDWARIISGQFERVLLPAKTLDLLSWEHTQLNEHGQPYRDQPQAELYSLIERLKEGGKIVIHDDSDLPEAPAGSEAPAREHTPDTIEAQLSRARDLVYINDTAEEEEQGRIVGLRVLADLLFEDGGIDERARERLGAYTHPTEEGERQLLSLQSRGSEVVVSMEALLRMAQAGALRTVCAFFSRIHISKPAWEQLVGDVLRSQHNARMQEEITRLRSSLRAALEPDTNVPAIQTGSVPDVQPLFVRRARGGDDQQAGDGHEHDDQQEGQEQDGVRRTNDALDALFAYYDELFALAHSVGAPIWTDDRFTSRIRLAEREVPCMFGTDAYLEWARDRATAAGASADDEYFALYERLVEWGYLGLPAHPEYLIWLLSRIGGTDDPRLERTLTIYRENMLDLLKAQEAGVEINMGYAQAVLSSYHQGLVGLMLALHGAGVDPKLAGAVFKGLDILRHTTRLEGGEPEYYASLLLSFVVEIYSGMAITDLTDVDGRLRLVGDIPEVTELGEWLDTMLQGADIPITVLCEAWYDLMHLPVRLAAGFFAEPLEDADVDAEAQILPMEAADVEDVTETTAEVAQAREKLAGVAYALRLLRVAPEYIRDYLAQTDLVPTLRSELGIDIAAQLFFELHRPDGTGTVKIRLDRWQRDEAQALERILGAEQQDGEVWTTEGVARLRGSWVSAGSLFLNVEAQPAADFEGYTHVQKYTRFVSIVGDATHEDPQRRTCFWRQGRLRLESLGQPTAMWDSYRAAIESADPDEYLRAARELETHLFGNAVVAASYLADAAQLGMQEIKALLEMFTPDIVRGWLDMLEFDWTTEGGLLSWASGQVHLHMQADDTNSNFAQRAADLLSSLGYSLFSDALVARQSVLTRAAGANSESKHETTETLLTKGETSVSLSMKANIVITVLALQHHDDVALERVQGLVGQIAQAWKGDRPPQASQDSQPEEGGLGHTLAKLERALCDWLYSVWRADPEHNESTAEQLAYLAFVAAGRIVDSLGMGSKVSTATAVELAEELKTETLVRWMFAPESARQPDGRFIPRWGIALNYVLGYFVNAIAPEAAHMVYSNVPLRHELLNAGLVEQVMQAFVRSAERASNWLDSLLPEDTSARLGDLLATCADGEAAALSESEMDVVNTCRAPESRDRVVAQQLAKIPEADEAEISSIIKVVLRARPAWGTGTYAILSGLLSTPNLDRIRLFREAYGELIASLLITLRTAQDMPEDVRQTIEDVVFEYPAGLPNSGDLLEAHALALAWSAAHLSFAEQAQRWLVTLVSDDQLPLSQVRRALPPFLEAVQALPPSVAAPLRQSIEAITSEPRLARLWEVRKYKRMQSDDEQPATGTL